nr:hypothetical protein [Rhizobium sp. Leaf384]
MLELAVTDPIASPHNRHTAVPLPIVLGLNRAQAAAFIGVSPSLFDEMVKDGRMPRPKTVGARRIWDRRKLEAAFGRLPGSDVNEDNDSWSVSL